MGCRLVEGPTMGGGRSDWRKELGRFLKPFLDRLGHKARRQMCPVYVSGLVGPGYRKSIQPMAERLAPGDYDQLHHFIAKVAKCELAKRDQRSIESAFCRRSRTDRRRTSA